MQRNSLQEIKLFNKLWMKYNEKVKNNLILDSSEKSKAFLHSITKIKSREYRSIDNVKSILFSDPVNSPDWKVRKQLSSKTQKPSQKKFVSLFSS